MDVLNMWKGEQRKGVKIKHKNILLPRKRGKQKINKRKREIKKIQKM